MGPTAGLETSSAEAEPFADERPRSYQYNMDCGESLKSRLSITMLTGESANK